MDKVMIKLLQGSIVMQTALGGLTTCIYHPVANYVQSYCRLTFWPPMYIITIIITRN